MLALAPAVAFAYTPRAGEGDALGAPPLVDMRGAAVDTTHGVTVLSFIYTRCPDPSMCPLVTAKFRRMSQLLGGTSIRLVEVTLDPAYDTPAVLRRYAAAAGADGRRWTLATGEPEALAGFAERMGLLVDRPRPGIVVHSEAAIIARDGIVEPYLSAATGGAPTRSPRRPARSRRYPQTRSNAWPCVPSGAWRRCAVPWGPAGSPRRRRSPFFSDSSG